MKMPPIVAAAFLLIVLIPYAGATLHAQDFAVRVRLSAEDTTALLFRAYALRLCDPCKFPKDIANIREEVDAISKKGKMIWHPVIFRKMADTASEELQRLRESHGKIASLTMEFALDIDRDKELEETRLEFRDVYLVNLSTTSIVTKPVSKAAVFEEYTMIYGKVLLGGRETTDHTFMKSSFVAPFVMPVIK